jgi:hypothetical protein
MPDLPYDRGAGRFKRIGANVLAVFTAVMLIGVVQQAIDAAGVLLVALPAVGAWLMYRSAARDADVARHAALGKMQLAVLELAKEDGRLTVTEVATRLGWTMHQAGVVLASLDDGLAVWSTPSDEGVMVYEFRELLHDPDRPRVQPSADPPPLPSSQPRAAGVRSDGSPG